MALVPKYFRAAAFLLVAATNSATSIPKLGKRVFPERTQMDMLTGMDLLALGSASISIVFLVILPFRISRLYQVPLKVHPGPLGVVKTVSTAPITENVPHTTTHTQPVMETLIWDP